MAFHPKIGDSLIIARLSLEFQPHPAAKNFCYGQTGRKGTVYQLKSKRGRAYALKVFHEAWRTDEIARSAVEFRLYQGLPGLDALHRRVLTRQTDSVLIRSHPDLEYAVLMPWIQGATWHDVVMVKVPAQDHAWSGCAAHLSHVLNSMEENNIAHCDISPGNVILSPAPSRQIELVDLEDLYAPGCVKLTQMAGGTPGYVLRRFGTEAQWSENADRFAGAILVTEMLIWHDTRARQSRHGDSFFSQAELDSGGPCDRYELAKTVLEKDYGASLANVFVRAWQSPSPGDCPTFQEWSIELESVLGETAHQAFEAKKIEPDPLWLPAPSKPALVEPSIQPTSLTGIGRWLKIAIIFCCLGLATVSGCVACTLVIVMLRTR